MIFRRFNIIVIFQILLLMGSIYLFSLAIAEERLKVTVAYISAIIIFQIIILIKTIRQNNINIINLLKTYKSQDVAAKLPKITGGKSFRELSILFDEFVDELGRLRKEKEKEYQFFKNTIRNVGTGLVTFNERGLVNLVNDAFLKIFNISGINNISELNKFYPDFEKTLFDLKSGEAQIIKFFVDEEAVQVSVKMSEFVIEGKRLKLVSFQNLKNELAQEEADSWQKLISVLRHEIMNSVGPISSLVSTLVEDYEERIKIEPDSETVNNTLIGLKAIEKRSVGLINFVEDYKKLTNLPEPIMENISLRNFLLDIGNLMETEFKESNIDYSINVTPGDIMINADERLISQVLINLIRNSINALKSTEKYEDSSNSVKINCYKHIQGNIIIEIEDKGPGISRDLLDKIFMPFFTTREEGSGIGLSLCRQIMKLHHGSISVKSEPDIKTIFTLKF
ncbi:PAS domain-containing sensor histidine kinase [Bacteroidota bacterium]